MGIACIWSKIQAWAKALKRDVIALWFIARDPRTPFILRVALGLVVAYALSPIDLIPDFIPVLGYLDEVLLLPVLLWLLLRFVPPDVLAHGREQAAAFQDRPRSWIGAMVILCLWGALVWLGWRWWYG